MRKFKFIFAAVIIMALVALVGCSSANNNNDNANTPSNNTGSSNQNTAGQDEDTLKVVALLNGNLGDKSFFDSANAGMNLIKDQLGVQTRVIEMGFDNTKWEPTLLDISEQDYDVIVVGTWQMQEILQKVAPQYPDKKYIIFDSEVDYSTGDVDNVYSITFKQNEASYLAGALAALISSDAELSNGKKHIGTVAAMDIPVLNDFIVGYIQGAKDVVPDIKVSISYIGDFDDTAKAKELGLVQFRQGSSVGFNVAAQAGLGLIDAAQSSNSFAIGVDADQALAMQETNPDMANIIVSSVLKNIDNVILRSIEMHMEGTLNYGQVDVLGIKEGAVGLADNEIYRSIVPQEYIDQVAELQKQIEEGEIEVPSAFTLSPEEVTQIKDSVKP